MAVDKFVVLHSQLATHRQGAVIEKKDLAKNPNDVDMARLLTIGAVRKATDAERGLTVVKDALFGPDLSYEEQLSRKEEQIKRLSDAKDAIEAEFSAFKAALKPGESGKVNETNFKLLMDQKDLVIHELQKKLRIAEKK